MQMNIIQVEQLSKTFKVPQKKKGLKSSLKSLIKRDFRFVNAVDSISFDIKEKEVVGLIGLNGAGKTTTLKMLSGLVYPSEGSVQILGYNPWKKEKEFLKDIGFLMGNKSQLWWDLPAIDSFYLEGDIYDINKVELEKNIEELVDLLDVRNLLDTAVRKLSLGERMKMEFILMLLHKPKVLFLDEPTIGLDVISQRKIRDFLRKYKDENGATILITSHNMKDIEELCNRIIIINEGTIIYDNTINKLKEKYDSKKTISVKYSNDNFMQDAKPILNMFSENDFYEMGMGHISLKVKTNKAEEVREKLFKLPGVREVVIDNISLEEILDILLK